MLIGHQKGRDTKEKLRRNFGMPQPEGYRKALRLMKIAEQFRLPLITLVDTPGAYPGIGAEERGQARRSPATYARWPRCACRIIVVIGEGGSGGALAIGVGDRLLMLQYAIYSVISPEGCAAILWKSADKEAIAADAMGITAERSRSSGSSMKSCASRSAARTAIRRRCRIRSRKRFVRRLDQVSQLPEDALVAQRYERLRGQGVYRAAN